MNFWVFHVYPRSLSISGISLGALQGPQHLAPGLLMHLHKAVCEFVSQVSTHHGLPGSATDPGKSAARRLHFMAQDRELWRVSGHEPEAPLALHQEVQWEASPLICAKASHDPLSPPASQAVHQGIRAPRLHGVGAEEGL